MDVGCAAFICFFRQPEKKQQQPNWRPSTLNFSLPTKIAANMMDWPKCCGAKNENRPRSGLQLFSQNRNAKPPDLQFRVKSFSCFRAAAFGQSISRIKAFFLSRDQANREDAKNYLQSLSQRLDIHGPKTRRETIESGEPRAKKRQRK